MRIPRLTPMFLLPMMSWCLFSAGAVPAQTVDAAEVTVDQLVELALSRNAELLAGRQRLAEAGGILRQAGFRPNPSIEVSAANGDALNSDGESEFSLHYSHIFELGGKREARVELARQQLETASRDVANRERLLAAEVRILYAEALAAVQKLKSADDLFDLTRKNLELAKARAEAGEAPPLEQGLLQVELNRIRSDRLLFASQVEQALLQLRLLAALPLDRSLKLAGSLDRVAQLPRLADAIELALSNRADLAAARAREQAAEAELKLARSEAVPNLQVRGGYTHVRIALDQFGFSYPGGSLVPLRDKDNMISGGISIELPLAHRNQGNIEAAIARATAARLAREALEQSIRQEIMAAFNRQESIQEALRVFDAGVVRQSEENLRIVRGAYELGELRLLDVITEQRRLVEIQRAYTDLQRDASIAAVELERAIGIVKR